MAENNKKNTFRLYTRLLRYILPFKLVILLTILTLFGLAALEPAKAYVLKLLLDEALIDQNPDFFVLIPLMIAGLFTVLGILDYCSRVASQWIAQKAIVDIRTEMFAKLQSLPLSTHHAYGTGKMMSKITYDVTMAGNALSNAWIVIIRDVLTVVALMVWLLYVSWQLTLILLIIVPVIVFLIDKASRKIRKASKQMQQHMGEMTSHLEQGIRGYKDIKIYNTENYENRQFKKIADDLFAKMMRVTRVSALNVPLVQVLAALAMSVIVYIAIRMVSDDFFTPGELIAYITAMSLTFEPVRRITNINTTVQKGMAAAESIFELLDREEERDAGTVVLPKKPLAIEFAGAKFSYQNTDTLALNDLNLIIPANKTTALVGQSGSGKTSIVNLITRFYQLDEGALTVGGHTIDELTLKSLRENIAFVSQNIVLLNDTVAANIAYGADDYKPEAVKAAAIKAHAWEFIEALPQGINTNIGDDGSSLSGGQRQRISLARAFFKNAPILILDEATSALDNQSEREIQAAMEEMKGQQTIIVIAHRLSSVEAADQIVVLEKGRVLESGSHQELLNKKGAYARLHHSPV